MQSVSTRIWTSVTVSISYDDNHYTTGTSLIYSELFCVYTSLWFYTPRFSRWPIFCNLTILMIYFLYLHLVNISEYRLPIFHWWPIVYSHLPLVICILHSHLYQAIYSVLTSFLWWPILYLHLPLVTYSVYQHSSGDLFCTSTSFWWHVWGLKFLWRSVAKGKTVLP